MATTDDAKLAAPHACRFRNHGIDSDHLSQQEEAAGAPRL